MEQTKVKEYYNELKGFQAVDVEAHDDRIWSVDFRESFNKIIELLSAETSNDYSRFLLVRHSWNNDGSSNDSYSSKNDFLAKVHAIVRKLEAQYPDLREDHEKQPSNIFNIQQSQSVEILMQLNLDLQSKIDSKLYNEKLNLNETEKTFLSRIKSNLVSVKDYAALVLMILTHAKDLKLSIEQIIRLLS